MEWRVQGDERNDLQPRLHYPEKLSFKTEGEIRSFMDKKKLKEFVNPKPALQLILNGLLY